MVAPGNPLGVFDLTDQLRSELRFANHSRGTGNCLLLDDWLVCLESALNITGQVQSLKRTLPWW